MTAGKEDSFTIGRNRLPQWRGNETVYFITWRLDDSSDKMTGAERSLVADVLKYFNEDRYRLAAYVVMDDHVHVLLLPLPPFSLAKILHSWKSYSAQSINHLRGVSGTRWQKDSHTRMIRDESELHSTLAYIIGNPQKRWPDIKEYKWMEWFDVI